MFYMNAIYDSICLSNIVIFIHMHAEIKRNSNDLGGRLIIENKNETK